ncbi:MAG: gentisate 1,2-dioxygenase [Candidatus Lambdaproteobacteria bacterium]|nr:gentisate 1,2-dioxygenase [Candidatus Lambdaproteobacteria bacterium]
MAQQARLMDRQAFYERIDKHELAPLWEVFRELITPEPRSPCLPHVWAYDAVRPFLMESGELISAKEAERRVLVLENPGMRGASCVTRSLYAGIQLVLPGEVAPCHRHNQSALRVVLEGRGGYTGVEGEHIPMQPGDFIITPSWAWHEHANPSAEPVTWLDGLDVPLVQLLDASFFEAHAAESQPRRFPHGYGLARHGANMKPADDDHTAAASPVNHYPYARSREALHTMRKHDALDRHHGLKMEFVNPLTGAAAMPTISTFIQLLPGGFQSRPYRSSDGTVYSVIEGHGETRVGDKTLPWGPRDTFVVPSWARHSHHADEESVLFSFSDRTVQQKLDLWHEEKE